MEAVNSDLVTKLQEMQAETENLLNRTIEYRRTVPQIIKDAYVANSAQVLKEIEGQVVGNSSSVELSKEDLELCNLDRSIKPNFYSNKLSSGLSHLTQLQAVTSDYIVILLLIIPFTPYLVYSGCCV